MQLPRILSPAFCCLLALAVQHVAGLVVPREAQGIEGGGLDVDAAVDVGTGAGVGVGVGVGVGAGSRLTVGQAQRRQVLEAVAAAPAAPEGGPIVGQPQRRQVAVGGEAKGGVEGDASLTAARAHRRQLTGSALDAAQAAIARAVAALLGSQ